VSQNWAGYVAGGTQFSSVSGSWVQPSADCGSGQTYSAFWVGLGGYSGGNGGLEQTGTESDCVDGQAVYSAWYELLPSGSVRVPMDVSPGDTISAEVAVDGQSATLTITDVTNGETFSTQQTPSVLDTSSAEWIAEAPSRCFGSRCFGLQLANFGTVQFSGSSTTANGHVGTISDASWSASSIALDGSAGTAQPADLSPDGTAFSIAVVQPQVQVQQLKPAKPNPKPKPKHKRKKKPTTL
jgi:hypothetical protein